MIFQQLAQQLNTLRALLSTLTDQQYTQKVFHLGEASIGGHARHILELLVCATHGYSTGTVDYQNRTRNLVLEQDRLLAQQILGDLEGQLQKPDKRLNLFVEESHGSATGPVSTTYYREIVYNTEHTIHHLALIKVALVEMRLDVVDATFGMAYSTLKYKAALTESQPH